VILHLDEEVFDAIMHTKDEFIVYLQDEIAELKAQLRVDTPTRIRNEVDFKSNRGYKSVYARVREQVLANKIKHTPFPAETEEAYEQIVIEENDRTN
jgi:hypothetical protein